IDNDEFYCHLLVLQSYSTFFDEMNDCKDIDLSDSIVTSKAFSIIYDWMISSMNESYQLLRRDNILEIFMASQYLGIKELEEQCWAFIDNDELFSEDTAFLLYLEAKKIGNTTVMELMVPKIMKFFLMLVSTKNFLELSVGELCLLLKSNYICINRYCLSVSTSQQYITARGCSNANGRSLNIDPLLEKLDISKIEWLHPLKSIKQKWIVILKLLHWFFAQYVIKILHKYIVLIPSRNKWLYIMKEEWYQIQHKFINEKINNGYVLLQQPVKIKKYNKLGVNRLTTSSSGLRIITKYIYKFFLSSVK
ncbi:uncharacterized protein LOC116846282, partial [Odontomachus brunneus]|uniref:uncharacterized protein LOC116846282 n=1 Tax=Odontomachus brunneus TaxID=486640 RepID=UPI0013F21ACA